LEKFQFYKAGRPVTLRHPGCNIHQPPIYNIGDIVETDTGFRGYFGHVLPITDMVENTEVIGGWEYLVGDGVISCDASELLCNHKQRWYETQLVLAASMELVPCMFCGTASNLVCKHMLTSGFYITCKCGARGFSGINADGAAKEWNKWNSGGGMVEIGVGIDYGRQTQG